MSAPRVWSRDDFLAAFDIVMGGSKYVGGDELRRVVAVLEFAEQNQELREAQPRGEHGRFVKRPTLHALPKRESA